MATADSIQGDWFTAEVAGKRREEAGAGLYRSFTF